MSKCNPTENISVTIPAQLLAVLDAFCTENDLSRSQMVNRAIRLYLGTKIAKTNEFWAEVYTRMEREGKV
jgi:metal-responsive CopG/Arc/MetJ family transcriptional regulator